MLAAQWSKTSSYASMKTGFFYGTAFPRSPISAHNDPLELVGRKKTTNEKRES
jgi:hypothetical protein